MRLLPIKALPSNLISGASGSEPGDIFVATTPGDLHNLVQPAGPIRPIPAHIDPMRPVWLGPNEGLPFWVRRPQPQAPQPQVPQQPRNQ